MCNPSSSSYGIINPTGKLLGDNYKYADPLMYMNEQNMKTPEIPAPPQPPQASRTPDAPTKRARKSTPSTMLTGPSGVAVGALNTGGATLLGG